jgi:hypothetical protein
MVKNKKGWLRTIEVTLAVFFVIGVAVAFAGVHKPKQTDYSRMDDYVNPIINNFLKSPLNYSALMSSNDLVSDLVKESLKTDLNKSLLEYGLVSNVSVCNDETLDSCPAYPSTQKETVIFERLLSSYSTNNVQTKRLRIIIYPKN